MKRTLGVLVVALALVACGGGGGYDGPGKNLVGEWEGDVTLDYMITGGGPGGAGGFGMVTISADGETLLVEDSECAFPAVGDGDDGLTFSDSDTCIKAPEGEPLRFHVTGGTGTRAGRFVTLELAGTLASVSGTDTGTFTMLFQIEEATGGGGEGGEGGGGGDGPGPGGG